MDILDKQLDDLIAYTLETEAIVTPAQKKEAWEKLYAKASQQVILAPYAVPPQPAPRRLQGWWGDVVRLMDEMHLFLSDESRFHRAAVKREALYVSKLNPAFNGSEQALMRFFPTAYVHLSMI